MEKHLAKTTNLKSQSNVTQFDNVNLPGRILMKCNSDFR